MTAPRRLLFCDFRLPGDPPAFAARLRGIGWTDVAFGPDWRDDVREFRPLMSSGALARVIEACHREGLVVWAMPWMHRDSTWLRAVASWCGELVASHGVGVCGDAEWGWIEGPGSGRPAAEAADEWASLSGAWPLRAITSYGLLPSAVAPLARVGGIGIPQAYADGSRPDPIYRPGALPARAMASWRTACREVRMGGSLFNLDHPGTADDGIPGIRKARAAMIRATPHEAWWSEKHTGPRLDAAFKEMFA